MKKPAVVFLIGAVLFAQNAGTLTEQYRERASKLIDASLADQAGMDHLAYLCDRIGNRLSGSAALEKAEAGWCASPWRRWENGSSTSVRCRRAPHAMHRRSSRRRSWNGGRW